MKTLTILFLSSLFLVTGCSSSSPKYAAASGSGSGYSESKLGENRYRVEYNGARSTSDDEVKDLALLRAAELTLLNNQDWFRVVSRDTNTETTNISPSIGVTQQRAVQRDCGLLGCTTTTTPVYTGVRASSSRNSERTTSSLEIVMGNGNAPDPTAVYDANELRGFLKGKYPSAN